MLASAPLAIAAMAALNTTPLSAQEQPVIVLEQPTAQPATTSQTAPVMQPSTTAQPAPRIVLPDPEPITVEPVEIKPAPAIQSTRTVEPVARPQASQSVAREAAPAPLPPATTRTTEAPAPIAELGTASTSPEEPALPTVTGAETDTATPPVALEPVPEPVTDGSGAALLLALLGVGGIGLAAFFLMRRRRRRTEVPAIERPIVATEATPEPVREPAMPTVTVPQTSAAYEPAPVAVAASNGAAVELPRELPRNPAERESLLKRMIEARPDRANPFRSYKARAKRARLILQSIGTRFTNRKPSIDLSQYTNVWPELRGWRPGQVATA